MISNSKKLIEEPFCFESPKLKQRNLEDQLSVSPINLYRSNGNLHANNLIFNSDDEKPSKFQINSNQQPERTYKKLNTIKIVAEIQKDDEAEIVIDPDLFIDTQKKESLGNVIGIESPIKLKYKVDSPKKSRNKGGKSKHNDSGGMNSSIFGYLSSRAYEEDDLTDLVKHKDQEVYEDFFN